MEVMWSPVHKRTGCGGIPAGVVHTGGSENETNGFSGPQLHRTGYFK